MKLGRSINPVLFVVATIHHKNDAVLYFLLHFPLVSQHVSSKYDLPLQGLASVILIISIDLLHLVYSHHVHLERTWAGVYNLPY